jgi:hypothetical protein
MLSTKRPQVELTELPGSERSLVTKLPLGDTLSRAALDIPLDRITPPSAADIKLVEVTAALRHLFRDGDPQGWQRYTERLVREDGASTEVCNGNQGGVKLISTAGGRGLCLKEVQVPGAGTQPLSGLQVIIEAAAMHAGPKLYGVAILAERAVPTLLVVTESLHGPVSGLEPDVFVSMMGAKQMREARRFLEDAPRAVWEREVLKFAERVGDLFDGQGMTLAHPDPQLKNAFFRIGRLADPAGPPPDGWFRMEGTGVVWRIDILDVLSFEPGAAPVERNSTTHPNLAEYRRDFQTAVVLSRFGLEEFPRA